jgi:ribosome biogenesis GTPase A
MPFASVNPAIAKLRGDTPCVKVLTKSDLADPDVTREWLAYFEAHGTSRVMAITTERQAETRTKIADACRALARLSRGRTTARAIIVGIPNVGKSTLMNTLAKRRAAEVGNEPAVTKSIQTITLPDGTLISDNPGILWPKIDDDRVGYTLALGGAIPDTAIDYEMLGDFAAGLLFERYPALVKTRYKITKSPESARDLLDEIGRRRGCLRSGGVVDRQKAGGILVHDLRSGALGRITLERPADR